MRSFKDSPNDATPVICLTANAISGMREMYINAGFDDYITKPISPDRLEAMLLKYLPKGKIAPASAEGDNDDYVLPDFIFHLGEIDVSSGLAHCGNGEAYIATLKMYLDTAEKNADDIENYWAARDIKNTTIKVHALKSTSRVIGALKLGDFAAKLEKAGDQGDTDTLDAELADLIAEYRKIAKDLEPLNEEEDSDENDDRTLITTEELNEAYTAISEFYTSLDFDSIVHIVESLKGYRFPEDEATRLDALIKAVDNYDYELIPGIIAGEVG
jgi:HPt (histidine-containing phosphotransfer) domain-containing protein